MKKPIQYYSLEFIQDVMVKLNQIDEKFEVLYYKKPSVLVPSNSKELVEKVYTTDLDTSLKKFIVNINLGLIEKKKTKKQFQKCSKITMKLYIIKQN